MSARLRNRRDYRNPPQGPKSKITQGTGLVPELEENPSDVPGSLELSSDIWHKLISWCLGYLKRAASNMTFSLIISPLFLFPKGYRGFPTLLEGLSSWGDTQFDCLGHMGLYKLGAFYLFQFERSSELEDLEKATKYLSRALALTPEGYSGSYKRTANLGLCYGHWFQRLGGVHDIEKAIEYTSRTLSLIPIGHSHFPYHLSSLGIFHGGRFIALGKLDDIEKSMEYASRALALTPDNHPDLPHLLTSLGSSHEIRFQRLGELDDVEKAIKYLSRALDLTPNGDPGLPHRLATLGSAHNARFERLDQFDDIEKAIAYKSRVIALIPDDHPKLPGYLASLGRSYSSRFQRRGDPEDMEKEVEYMSRALALTPDGHPILPHRLARLGESHSSLFQRLGGRENAENAIEYMSRVLASVEWTDDHPHLPYWLTNLGKAHGDRFQRLGKLDDIEKAIKYVTRALNLTPDDHPDLPSRLSLLGWSHDARFRHLARDDFSDMEKAIEYKTRAIELTPDGHPYMTYLYSSLGVSHTRRFEHLDNPNIDDIKRAVEYISCALVLTPEDHPDLPSRHFHFAIACFYQYQCTGDPSHLQNSLASFRRASQSSTGAPRDKFKHSLHWATLASQTGALECIEAYQTTIRLLPQFVWLGATTNQRYEDLEMAEGLAVKAASAAISSSEYELALEWLEHARCVVWSQNLMLRSPLDHLRSSHPALASSLQTVADELRDVSSESRDSGVFLSDSTPPEKAAQRHRRLAKKYDELLIEARALPGFDNFLRPMKANDLVRAARNGPIVVINCHTCRCDALIIIPGQQSIHHVPLPNFNEEKALRARQEIRKSLGRKGLRERGVKTRQEGGRSTSTNIGSVLVVLWDELVKPVLDFLGYRKNVLTETLPHIIWCPTGVTSFLPLHAAGDYDQPQSCVFDYVVSSYTPTLTALLSSVPSSLSPDTRVLAVGQERTPGHSPLPGTAEELAYLESHTQNIVKYMPLTNDQATTAAVLDAMEQHNWVHLACHAHQNVKVATKSGFYLHNDTLDLASINRRSFKNKGLAFLSACQTATGNEELPDEAIHLASGMLMAGYPSVIATMWSVSDKDAPFVADKVYGKLMKGAGIGNGEAGKALHNAVAELRDKIGEKEYERWVPYIHIGS